MDILITILTAFISGAMATALGALGSVILTALLIIVYVLALFCFSKLNMEKAIKEAKEEKMR